MSLICQIVGHKFAERGIEARRDDGQLNALYFYCTRCLYVGTIKITSSESKETKTDIEGESVNECYHCGDQTEEKE